MTRACESVTARGGGAAASEASERAGASERDERRCDGRRRGRRRQDGEATERGQDGVPPPLACGEELVGMSGGCGPVCMPVCCVLSCAFPFADPSTLPATTWAFDDGQLPGQAFSIIAPT